jgi:hypothetical protein
VIGVPRAISRCPNCREPVSQFAAGCAVCGSSLLGVSLVGLIAYAQIWGGLIFGL